MLSKPLIFLEISGLPKNVANAQGSWLSRYSEMKKWKRLVEEALVFSRQRPDKPLQKAHLRLTRFSTRKQDYDNLAHGFKSTLDALKKSGVIIDDSPEVIGRPDYEHGKAAKNEGYIRIEVWDVNEKV